jgi:hypothetical protein
MIENEADDDRRLRMVFHIKLFAANLDDGGWSQMAFLPPPVARPDSPPISPTSPSPPPPVTTMALDTKATPPPSRHVKAITNRQPPHGTEAPERASPTSSVTTKEEPASRESSPGIPISKPAMPKRKSNTRPKAAQLERSYKRLRLMQDSLITPEIAWSKSTGVEELRSAQSSFFAALSSLKVQIIKDNKPATHGFKVEEATAITNFFFIEVMGPEAHQRLRGLASYYNTYQKDLIDIGAATRAGDLAKDTTNPVEIQRFYSSFYRAHSHSIDSHTIYASLMRTTASVDLYSEWSSLRDLANRKDLQLKGFLAHKGYVPSRGVDLRTLVNKYLADQLRLSSVLVLHNACQSAQGIAEMVNIFGSGVLPLLPAQTNHQ